MQSHHFLFERRHRNSVNLGFNDSPVTFRNNDLLVEAVRIPHSGWPNRMLDVENIAWRVTLNDNALNLGSGLLAHTLALEEDSQWGLNIIRLEATDFCENTSTVVQSYLHASSYYTAATTSHNNAKVTNGLALQLNQPVFDDFDRRRRCFRRIRTPHHRGHLSCRTGPFHQNSRNRQRAFLKWYRLKSMANASRPRPEKM